MQANLTPAFIKVIACRSKTLDVETNPNGNLKVARFKSDVERGVAVDCFELENQGTQSSRVVFEDQFHDVEQCDVRVAHDGFRILQTGFPCHCHPKQTSVRITSLTYGDAKCFLWSLTTN